MNASNARRRTAWMVATLAGALVAALPTSSVYAAASPTTILGAASGPIAVGGTVQDTVQLSGGSGTLTGTISYQVFGPGDSTCSTPLAGAPANSTVGAPIYASDTFNRSVANGWGSADVGGAWTISGAEAPNAFSVDAVNLGQQTTISSGDTAVAGLGSQFANVDAKVKVKFDQGSGLTSTLENRARILLRASDNTDNRLSDYEFALSEPVGKTSLDAYIAKREGGHGTDVQLASDTSTGLGQDASSYFSVCRPGSRVQPLSRST